MLLPMLPPDAAWVQHFGVRLGCFGGTSSDFHPMCCVIQMSLLGSVLAWVQMVRCVALCDEASTLSVLPISSSPGGSPGPALPPCRAALGWLGLHRDTPRVAFISYPFPALHAPVNIGPVGCLFSWVPSVWGGAGCSMWQQGTFSLALAFTDWALLPGHVAIGNRKVMVGRRDFPPCYHFSCAVFALC